MSIRVHIPKELGPQGGEPEIMVAAPGEIREGGIVCKTPADALRVSDYMRGLSPEQREYINSNPIIGEIIADGSLSDHQRKLKLLPHLGRLRREIDETKKKLDKQESELGHKRQILDAAEQIKPWFDLPEYRLEKNDCSRIHQLAEAMKLGNMIVDGSTPLSEADGTWNSDYLSQYRPFVVQHSWASAFKNATDYAEGQINLPFSQCVFEFRVSGKTIATLARQEEDGPIHLFPFIQINHIWGICAADYVIGDPGPEPLFFRLIASEIRAICIALDAEVATRDLVRAPFKLNRQREKDGKIPLYDYHVVKLHGSHRMNRKLIGGTGTHRSPRLHFRRGHWRHYESHKTWIKWMLVGNPELGFIDQEYRL
jgi:hypothetical protein